MALALSPTGAKADWAVYAGKVFTPPLELSKQQAAISFSATLPTPLSQFLDGQSPDSITVNVATFAKIPSVRLQWSDGAHFEVNTSVPLINPSYQFQAVLDRTHTFIDFSRGWYTYVVWTSPINSVTYSISSECVGTSPTLFNQNKDFSAYTAPHQSPPLYQFISLNTSTDGSSCGAWGAHGKGY